VSLILDKSSLDLISHSSDQTRRLGAHLGALLQPGQVVCLQGDLGVGKTCLVQGIGQGLGIEGPIRSPSFTLVCEHTSASKGVTLFHVDLYRLDRPVDDALAIGLDEYLYGDGICVIEWAERAQELMPSERLTISMRFIDHFKRGLLMQAAGAWAEDLLMTYRAMVFGA
jgi:tRNA threonylcarbamoyladenosine biosynthesis protein TsaE